MLTRCPDYAGCPDFTFGKFDSLQNNNTPTCIAIESDPHGCCIPVQ